MDDEKLFTKRNFSLHTSSSRPQLPSSTPAPGIAGRPNAYSAILPPKIDSIPSQGDPQTKYSLSQKKIPDTTLNKIITKLPYGVRENVSSVMNLALSNSDAAQKQVDATNLELLVLRNELKKKTKEHENTKKRCDIYVSRLELLEEKLGGLQDTLESKKKYSIRSKRAVNRLSNTNRMLIDAFEALQDTVPGGDKDREGTNSALSSPKTLYQDDRMDHEQIFQKIIEKEQNRRSSLQDSLDPSKKGIVKHTQKNDKLRESLLRIAREHYRSVKATESLEITVDELRSNLVSSQKKVRQLEIELNDLRELANDVSHAQLKPGNSADSTPFNGLTPGISTGVGGGSFLGLGGAGIGVAGAGAEKDSQSYASTYQQSKSKRYKEQYEAIDNRMKALIQKNAMQPMDCVNIMRRILTTFSHISHPLDLLEVAATLCSKSTCRLFDVESISLCLLQPNKKSIMKYSYDPFEAELISLTTPVTVTGEAKSSDPNAAGGDQSSTSSAGSSCGYVFTKSIAQEAMRSGNIIRVNNLSLVTREGRSSTLSFHPEIDGSARVQLRRLMFIPIENKQRKEFFGTLIIYNKSNSAPFSEADEVFATIFADFAGTVLSSCVLYKNVSDQADLFHHLLEASSGLFSAIPDPHSLAASKAFTVDDVLTTLERISKEALKCKKSKVFLMSEYAGNKRYGSGNVVSFETAFGTSKVTFTASKTKKISSRKSGIVGRVCQSKTLLVVMDPEEDEAYNPEVDLDPCCDPLITVPVVDLNGQLLACIQLVAGPHSPRLADIEDDPALVTVINGDVTSTLCFERAASWFAYQIASPLAHLLTFIGKSASRPSSTPKQLVTGDWVNAAPLSLMPKQFFPPDVREIRMSSSDIFNRAQSQRTMRHASSGSNTASAHSLTNLRHLSQASVNQVTVEKGWGGKPTLGEELVDGAGDRVGGEADTYPLPDEESLGGEVVDVTEEKAMDRYFEENPLTTTTFVVVTSLEDDTEGFVLGGEPASAGGGRMAQDGNVTVAVSSNSSNAPIEPSEIAKDDACTDTDFELVDMEDYERVRAELHATNKTVTELNEKMNEYIRRQEVLSTAHVNLQKQLEDERKNGTDSESKHSGEIRILLKKLQDFESQIHSRDRLQHEQAEEIQSLQSEVTLLRSKEQNLKDSLSTALSKKSSFKEQARSLEQETALLREEIRRLKSNQSLPQSVLSTSLSGDDRCPSPSGLAVGGVGERTSGREDESLMRRAGTRTGAAGEEDVGPEGGIDQPMAPVPSPPHQDWQDRKLSTKESGPGQVQPGGTTYSSPLNLNIGEYKNSSVSASPRASSTTRAVPTPTAKQLLAVAASGEGNLVEDIDWVEIRDGVNDVYYYNHVTCESSWTRPARYRPYSGHYDATATSSGITDVGQRGGLTNIDHKYSDSNGYPSVYDEGAPQLSPEGLYEAPRQGDWVQALDETGNSYWYNEVTGVSAWELPEDALLGSSSNLPTNYDYSNRGVAGDLGHNRNDGYNYGNMGTYGYQNHVPEGLNSTHGSQHQQQSVHPQPVASSSVSASMTAGGYTIEL